MRTYPSKLLLFGEHILLLGSTALALPLSIFGGKWVENGAPPTHELQDKMKAFAQSDALKSIIELDTTAFFNDLENGLVFESNIPMGYGLGSSGALCAAVYDRYCKAKSDNLVELKVVFAKMEGFFHGASSGIDPLTSYTGKPLLIQDKTTVSIATISPWEQPPIVLLLDSKLPRQTGSLVRWFLDEWESVDFARKMEQEYLPVHELLVQSWLAADTAVFWPNLRRVSQFQLDNFNPMIPASIRDLWTENLGREEIVFKICGAGGGGYFLGFSSNVAAIQTLAKKFNIVFPFQL